MIHKSEVVKKIHTYTGVSYDNIRAVLRALRRVSIEGIRECERVCLFTGLSVEGVAVPERVKKIFGEEKIVPAHVRCKAIMGTGINAHLDEDFEAGAFDDEEYDELDDLPF